MAFAGERLSRRFILGSMLGAAGAGLLAACSAGAPTPTPAPKQEAPAAEPAQQPAPTPTAAPKPATPAAAQPSSRVTGTVRLGTYVWGDHVVESYKNIIKKHETANPGVKVQFEFANYSDYAKKLQTQIASGNPPDLTMVIPDVIPPYVARELLVDLTPYMKADNSIHLDEWYKVAWESLTDETGQKYYAVPVTFDCDMLYYNKDMFDAAGLKYPTDNWTYDDMVDAAVKLHKKEGNNVTKYGLTFGWLPWLVFIEANGGTVWDKDQFYTKSTADSPEAIGGIQFMADLYHQYQVVAKPGTAPQVGNLFKAGLAAMMVTGGSWSIQDYNKSITKFKWDVAMPPTNAKSPKKMRPSVGQDNIFIMFKITKDRDATWAFMKELALTEEAQATLATDLETPAMKKVAEGKYKKEVLSPPNGPENGFKVLEAMEKYTRPVQNGLVLEDVWFDVGNKTFDGVWRGTKTPEAACKEFANACNELLADAKKKLGR